ncbi:DnaA N-terminal domain-containing protein [Azospirillum baldaniorum]|uniref:DnaA N-terminal domain-containing protein n=1 Tax=Azospirillum baldaniorum TaxID=1064539 RepID=UPI001013D48D|nr:DnaA N-terminal domain-containing protein [Azospirillum baldaniorum]
MAIELDGGSAVLWVPNAFQRDWIDARLTDRLKSALGIYSLEVRVGAPPAMSPARTRPTLHAVAGGRA